MKPILPRIRDWARAIKADIVALWIAARDPRVPLGAKLMAGIIAAYALSPIDLIPDFIPVIGYLDDLILVPAGIWLAIRMIPPPLLAEFRARAKDAGKPSSRAGAVAIVLVWIAAVAVIVGYFWR